MTPAALVAESGLPHLEAEVLVAHALGHPRDWLAAHSRDALDADQAAACEAVLARRRAGEPVAYIVGEREFFGLVLHVSRAVLIPRPETELLVELALAELERHSAGSRPRVLDLATGSGAVAIAIARHAPQAEVFASDVSTGALAVASANARRHAVPVRFHAGNWFTPFTGERFAVIVANPPYVAANDPHLAEGDLRYEPRSALVSGRDGLAALDAIVAGAPAHLAPRGLLLLEHGHEQGARCRASLVGSGFDEVHSWRDLSGTERVTGGRMARPAVDRSCGARHNS